MKGDVTMKKSLILPFVGALMVVATPLIAVEVAPQVKANAVMGRLNLAMRTKLLQSIQQNGLAGAMNVCAKEAPVVVADLEKTFGVTIKRTALTVRNPANAPDPEEKALLEKLVAMQKNGDDLPQDATLFSETEKDKYRILRYYKPVMMQGMCVGCHGTPDKIPADIKKALAASYPKDKALGYKEGDVRGIISVTVREKIPENELKK
jgi:hypothetical protein